MANNDVWKFDVITGNWTLVATTRDSPLFRNGTAGQYSATFYPMYRSHAACTTDGNFLYLFGGSAKDIANQVLANDLWVFSFSLGQWAWLHGDASVAGLNNAVYSKTPAAANIPYPRRSGVLHIDKQNCLWVRALPYIICIMYFGTITSFTSCYTFAEAICSYLEAQVATILAQLAG
jgi:hypothetical protein